MVSHEAAGLLRLGFALNVTKEGLGTDGVGRRERMGENRGRDGRDDGSGHLFGGRPAAQGLLLCGFGDGSGGLDGSRAGGRRSTGRAASGSLGALRRGDVHLVKVELLILALVVGERALDGAREGGDGDLALGSLAGAAAGLASRRGGLGGRTRGEV
jgi:hypothetical protein